MHELDTYTQVLAAAKNSANVRGEGQQILKLNSHNEEPSDPKKKCSKPECGLFGCPFGNDQTKTCDVMGDPHKWRTARIERREDYRALVDSKRAAAGRALLFPQHASGKPPPPPQAPPVNQNSHGTETKDNDEALTTEEIQAMIDSVNAQFGQPASNSATLSDIS